ncbi:MAG: hypothetical protein IPL59_17045 [Candidatus Competibacteraceae bacterium]|nr:hypothetical protein [Candidatus Competibacteraceae bacterium]
MGISKEIGFVPWPGVSPNCTSPRWARKAGAVFCPLFSAFGPEPVRVRLSKSRARVLVTTALLYQRKVRAQRVDLPDLAHVLLTDSGGAEPGVHSFHALLDAESDAFTLPFTAGRLGAVALHQWHHRYSQGAIHVREAHRGPPAALGWFLRCGPATFTGCTPILAGSLACPTASSPRWRTV